MRERDVSYSSVDMDKLSWSSKHPEAMLLYRTLMECIGNQKKSESERGLLQKMKEVRGSRGHRRRSMIKIQYTLV